MLPDTRQSIHFGVNFLMVPSIPIDQSQGEHAFQFLWEQRLHRSAKDLGEFGRPVLGGGLRFVMPPTEPEAPQIQVKIESFLRDSRKIFVETQFVWQQPVPPEEGLAPKLLLDQVEAFATRNVADFIQKPPSEP